MLRLLLLTLLLIVKAATSDSDGSGDDGVFPFDDEDQHILGLSPSDHRPHLASEVKNDPDSSFEDSNTTIIIITAVCVVALAIVSIIAVVLFRRHLQRREQGVYSVPVEQGQKGV